MKENRCVKFYQFGNPESVLTIEKHEIMAPKQGEILVRMIARPINPSDLIPIRGSYANRISLPGIPGYEGVGIVADVGPNVSRRLIGKRVLPLRGEGTWQEYVRASSEWAIEIPDSIDNITAAQLYINPVTAWVVCSEILKLRSGDTLAVNACGSSLGRIFAQYAKIFGFRLIAIVRNNKYTNELLEIGAAHVINTEEIPLKKAIMEVTNGKGLTAAIDSIGGTAGTLLAYCLQPRGTLVNLGLLSGKPINQKEIFENTKANLQLFHLRHWNANVTKEKWHTTFRKIIALVQGNQLKLMNTATEFPLPCVVSAVRFAQNHNGNNGKIFLKS